MKRKAARLIIWMPACLSLLDWLARLTKRKSLKVGTYTSPHVLSLGERVQINGVACPEADLLAHFRRHAGAVRRAQEESRGRLTHFEALTGLALKYFSAQRVDLAVVEAGLGGVTDATNVFSREQLALVAVTFLEREHTEVLGEDLGGIIAAKVGVAKRGTPVLVAAQASEDVAARAVAEGLRRNGGSAPVLRMRDFWESPSGAAARLKHLAFPQPEAASATMAPPYVLESFRTALAAALLASERLGVTVSEEHALGALAGHALPGRFQVLRGVKGRSEGQVVVLDGAHTALSAAALVRALKQRFLDRGYGRATFVVGMARDKEACAFMAALAEARPSLVICTTAGTERSMAPGDLVRAAREAGLRATAAANFAGQ